jgi:hypothetical protein
MTMPDKDINNLWTCVLTTGNSKIENSSQSYPPGADILQFSMPTIGHEDPNTPQ